MNDKNVVLMDDIMQGICQTDEWQDILSCDPRIVAANAHWNNAMEKVKSLVPQELYDELCEANAGEVIAAGDTGILFGIRVADVIRDVASRPADLSRHILERMEGKS